MTKPTSRLGWVGDTRDPLAVWVSWVGAGWNYTLHWGDGSAPTRMAHWQPPVKHTYPRAGTYTVTAVSDLDSRATASDKITVRGGVSPDARVDDLGGGRCRLRLRSWPDPVDYLVDWGDGATGRYGADQLTPQHTYPLGIDQPTITVVDVPARRRQRLDGPHVPPQPSTTPRIRWLTTDPDTRAGELRLSGFPPEVAVTVGWTGRDRPTVTDTNGNAVLADLTWTAPFPSRWHSVKAGWSHDERDYLIWRSVQPATMVDGAVVASYDIDPDDPTAITLLAYTGVGERRYAIHWGDDTTVEATPGPDGWVQASHRYPNAGPWLARLEGLGPGGQISDRWIQPATARAVTEGPDYIDYDYAAADPCDQAALVRAVVDGPTGRRVWQVNRYACGDAGVRFGLPDPGDYTATFHTAMADPVTVAHTTKTRGTTPRGPQPKGQKHMSGPPALVAEGYVYAKTTVGLRITNLFAWADKASLSSPAFGDSKPFELEIKTEEGRRFARASIPIAEADAGEYAATLHLPHGMTQQLRVIVEDRGDGTFEAAWAKVPDGTGNLHSLRAAGLSRNASHAQAKTPLAVGNDWFGMIKEPYGTNAKGTAVPAADLKPGATYPVEVKLMFPGGFEDIVKGAVTLPLPEPKAVLPGFKVRHEVNLAAVGEDDTITHKISFGSLKQTNTEYVVAWTRKCHDPQGKPVKPTREEAAELALLEPYHYVRHLEHVELHTVNPHKLRGNTRFRPIYIVKIDPVVDDDSFSGGDQGDEGEHDSAGAGR